MAETLQIPTKVRYDWIDVLKFFGIWAVYISHTGDGAVVLHPVVHTFCVELFFFISGFFACKKSDAGFRDFVFRRFPGVGHNLHVDARIVGQMPLEQFCKVAFK